MFISNSKSRWDYPGYRRTWLSKSDLTPKELRKYDIVATVEEIKEKCTLAIDGFVITGGMGHHKKVFCYSIMKLNDIFRKGC